MQHIVVTIPKLNNQNHCKRIAISIRKAVNFTVILSPNDRRGRIILRVIKFIRDKVNLQCSETTMHAGNHVIIKKKLAITVMPANKLLHKNYYNNAQGKINKHIKYIKIISYRINT